ncbi:MAG TPA: DUF262 domain-containing protein [Longimicrobiaceae bacterium]|jgi:uncharacterized protein with ParB-like and HNH nuclease domain|nr:DUF262 domain-containing protein [Longimicrobiaceae bacterium]
MNAIKQTLGRIFGQSLRLVAPVFQRPYVWKKEANWQPIWDAVTDVAERRLAGDNVRPHFLGAVVLDQLRTPPATLTTAR